MAIPLGAFITFIPLLADSREIGGTGLVYAVFAVASAAARPLAGRAADRWGPRPAVTAGLALSCLAAGTMAVAHVQWLLMVAALILGVGFGLAGPALDGAVQGGVRPSLRGSATAIQYTAFDALIGFGGLGLGALADAAGYGPMYAVVSGIVLVGLLAGLLIKMPQVSRMPR
jgi:DHA1 family multidrug resistance protein-like MFS transporter